MRTIIGGFSKEQYNSYLCCPLDKLKWKSAQWINCLAVLINRMAYVILHGFKEYLSNAKLFQKFKSHDFTKIDSKTQYETAKYLFKRFQACPEIDKTQLNSIKEKLKQVKLKLEKVSDQPDEPIKGGGTTDGDGTTEVVKKPEDSAKTPTEGADSKPSRSEPQKPPSNQSTIVPPTAGQTLDKPAPILNTGELPKVQPPPQPKGQDTLFDDDPLPLPEEEESQKDSKPEVLTPPIKVDGPDENNTLNNPPNPPTDTDKIEFEPLPANVEAILSQPFPLSKDESIQDLFSKGNEERLKGYQRHLIILRHYAAKLHSENKAVDPRFGDYMKLVDDAFMREWNVACQKAKDLHEDFKKFNDKYTNSSAIKLSPDGEIVCQPEHLEWVTSKIRLNFRALYVLSFDAPFFGIYQEGKMARLAQLILAGPAANGTPEPPPCFIQLDITKDLATPAEKDDTQENPLMAQGSFLQTQLFGDIARVDQIKRREVLLSMGEEFVTSWLKREGTTLQLPGKTLKSGQSLGDVKAEDFAAQVRDGYVRYLEGLSQINLQNEIQLLMQSFSNMGVGSFVEERTHEETIEAVQHYLLKRIFKDQLAKAGNEESLRQAIQKTIDDAINVDPIKFKMFAEYPTGQSSAESMIALRILYLLPLLGEKINKTVISGIEERLGFFYDPAVCKKRGDVALNCLPGNKQITLNDGMDALEVTVEAMFEDPKTKRIVGSAQSSLSVSSIIGKQEDKVKTERIDMKDLKFSLYSTSPQRNFLVAQIIPKRLIAEMKKLDGEVSQLEAVKQAKTYFEEEETYRKSLWFYQNYDFDKNKYGTLKYDSNAMDVAVRKARIFARLSKTFDLLVSKGQLDSDDQDSFNNLYSPIRKNLRKIEKAMDHMCDAEYWFMADKKEIITSYRELQRLRQLADTQIELN